MSLYPPRPDLARARALARGNLRRARGNFYCSHRAPTLQVCQVAQANLREIGLELELKLFPRVPITPPEQRRGEPFDIVHQAWHADYFDPHAFLFLVDGWTIEPANNTNTAYFNVLAYNRKIRDARLLTGARRYAAFAALDHEIMRDVAPVAVYGVPNDRHYVSARTRCYHYHPVYTYDLPAICLRR